MSPQLEWIELEAFRGFADEQRVPLGPGSLVVSGPNGLGKTSLVDALAWVFTGALSRLDARKERRTDEVIVNCYRPGATARVSVGMVAGERRFTITRTGSTKGSLLAVDDGLAPLSGEEAERACAERFGFQTWRAFADAVTNWGVLRQDAIRAVLDAPADMLQQRLRDILGLGVLGDFETAAKSAHKRETDRTNEARARLQAARAALSAREAELAALQAAAADAEAVERAMAEFRLLAARAEGVEITELPDTDATSWRTLRERIRNARMQLDDLMREAERLREAPQTPTPTAEAVELARAEVEALEESHLKAASALAESDAAYNAVLRREADLSALASAALPLLTDHCPVCAQSIDREDVARRLQELAAASATPAADLLARRDKALQANDQAATNLATAQARLRELEDAARVGAAWQAIRSTVSERARALIGLTGIALNIDPVEPIPITAADYSSKVRRLNALDLAAGSVVAALQAVEAATNIPALRSAVDAARAQEVAVVEEVARLARRDTVFEALAKAATTASVAVTEQWLEELNPLFGEVYRRLAPHPTFSELTLSHDVYYGRGRSMPRTIDPVTGTEANPNAIFSEGQLNVVALSYFIAFALSAGPMSLPFLVLDDPVQFLDDPRLLSFADLCRMLRDQYQLIVTTHDRRVADLLIRKLTPRRPHELALGLQFESWDRRGPTIRTQAAERREARALLEAA